MSEKIKMSKKTILPLTLIVRRPLCSDVKLDLPNDLVNGESTHGRKHHPPSANSHREALEESARLYEDSDLLSGYNHGPSPQHRKMFIEWRLNK